MAKKCLIVDDVSVSRYANRVVVQRMGLDVVEADGVDTCLDAVQKDAFDVILLDWHLRRESGLELIQKIRNTQGNKRAAIIVCSGVEAVEAATQAKDAGANSFIVKPATQEKLMVEFERLLGVG